MTKESSLHMSARMISVPSSTGTGRHALIHLDEGGESMSVLKILLPQLPMPCDLRTAAVQYAKRVDSRTKQLPLCAFRPE